MSWSGATARSSRTLSFPATSRQCSCPGSAPAAGRCSQARSRTRASPLDAFRAGTGGAARPIVDLNFNLEPEGCLHVAKALEPYDLLWLEVHLFDPGALGVVRARAPMPICSGENLYAPGVLFLPRLRCARRGVRRRHLERLPPGEEDRRTSRRRSRSPARRTTTTRISRPSSAPSGAPRSRTRASSSSMSTTFPGASELVDRRPGDHRRRAACPGRPRVGRRGRRGRAARHPWPEA